MRSAVTPFAFPPQGPPGVSGTPGDYGYIRYGEMTGSQATDMSAFRFTASVAISGATMAWTVVSHR